jgi:hypothetical protein
MEPQVTEIPVAEALTGGPLISKAPSPSGKAEVCKTSTPGSNPGGASNIISKIVWFQRAVAGRSATATRSATLFRPRPTRRSGDPLSGRGWPLLVSGAATLRSDRRTSVLQCPRDGPTLAGVSGALHIGLGGGQTLPLDGVGFTVRAGSRVIDSIRNDDGPGTKVCRTC